MFYSFFGSQLSRKFGNTQSASKNHECSSRIPEPLMDGMLSLKLLCYRRSRESSTAGRPGRTSSIGRWVSES